MTEEEAKKRWCPFVRLTGLNEERGRVVARDGGSAFNRGMSLAGDARFLPGTCCIAADCMAWRWSEAKRTAAFLEAVQAHMQTQAKPNFNTAVQAVYAERGGSFERVDGYCGLAGAPQ